VFFVSTDLTAAAEIAVHGLRPEVLAQEDSHLAVFRWERTRRFEQVVADLAAGRLTSDPAEVDRERKALRSRAILVNAAKRSRP
jgi:hypothetical protein